MIRTASSERWLVLGALGLAYFFVNFATFASLGVVLFTMVRDLNWSMTAAGFTFSLLGLACGLSSTLPTIAMKYFGGRGSMAIGAALFLVGCLLASASHSLIAFDVAIAMMGAGYTFAGNIPGVILIAQWFERGSARIIGIYLMVGALGTAAAPPTVEFVVRELGWRAHWEIMSAVALAVGLVCLAFVRDLETSTAPAAQPGGSTSPSVPAWTPRQAVFTIQFAVLTAALVFTMTAVTTINGIVVTHLAKLGLSPAIGAWALGVLSFTGTLMKGATGHLCESKSPKAFVVLGLLCQAAGCALLIVSTTTIVAFAAAILFGAGWAFAFVAGWVVLMRYFGGLTGARILAIVQLVTTVGAAGPIGAGIIADRWGTFTPIFAVYAIVLFALIIPVALVRPPALNARKAGEYEPAAVAEPA
jgi:MFS family permease